MKQNMGKGPKILTPKQMLQRLPIAHAQVKAGNTSGNLRSEITKIIYSLHRAKQITKNVYRPRDQANLVLNSTENTKACFLLFLMCLFPESNRTKF